MKTFTFRLLAVLGVLATTAVSAAHATRVLHLDTKSITATVSIDAALKAYPVLYADLLAESRRDVAQARENADEDREVLPGKFEDKRYSFERIYRMRSAIGRYVSIVRTDGAFSGGAYATTTIDTILWDARTNRRIGLGAFFVETADNGPTLRALVKAIRAALTVEMTSLGNSVTDPDKDRFLAAVNPELFSIGAPALAPSTRHGRSAGLLFYFSPYALGPRERAHTAFVPWPAFKAHLSGDGAGLFGGERPASDISRN